MSCEGENIKNMMSETKRFFKQISLLLTTVDSQIKKEKWIAISNTSIGEQSKHIDYPYWWLPTEAFRFYTNNAYPKTLGFVSILLDDDRRGYYEIKEPLVTGGYFDYATLEKLKDDNDYLWYARYFGYLFKDNSLTANGDFFTFFTKDIAVDLQGDFESGKVFAIPLTTISDEKTVKREITDRLVTLFSSK